MSERDGEISARVPGLLRLASLPRRYAKIKAKRIELSERARCSIHKSGTTPPAPHSTEYSLDPHRISRIITAIPRNLRSPRTNILPIPYYVLVVIVFQTSMARFQQF